jgi:ABC-type dipeptide/oligopeptide/nickel transport system ATPase subunit
VKREIDMTTKPILSVRNLSVVYPDSNGGLHALDNISFEVPSARIRLFPRSIRFGQDDLLRVLAGFLQPTSGSVSFMHHHQPKHRHGFSTVQPHALAHGDGKHQTSA